MMLSLSRRRVLRLLLGGTGGVGLRALATGLPPALIASPRRALAAMGPTCPSSGKAQFVIFATSGQGDPLNANVPGTYLDPGIVHSSDPAMAPTPVMLRGQAFTAAAPWATLPGDVLDRTTFWHLMTNTPVHPKEPDVLKLMGATYAEEMLPSILAKALAPCLGTIQKQPLCLGATSPAEGLSFAGAALPIIPALALKATLTSAAGMLTNLQPLRDQTLNQLYDLYKREATPAQRDYIDQMVTTQAQARGIPQDLLASLASIKDNSAASQITAAIALVRMKVTPAISIHIPFGGDNHRDVGLATETAQTVSGVGVIASLFAQLAAAGLTDQVTFATLNVFGRTIGAATADGRQHNANHQVSLAIGKAFKGGVLGGVAPLQGDYGAVAFDAATGTPSAQGDVTPFGSLACYGRTLLAALGVDDQTAAAAITTGKVVPAALSGA